MVEIAKVHDYCLNFDHPERRHKARVFRAVLGISPAESHMLLDRLLAAALDQEAAAGDVDQFGHRFVIDFPLEHAGRRALVSAAWIVLTTEDFPRLTAATFCGESDMKLLDVVALTQDVPGHSGWEIRTLQRINRTYPSMPS